MLTQRHHSHPADHLTSMPVLDQSLTTFYISVALEEAILLRTLYPELHIR